MVSQASRLKSHNGTLIATQMRLRSIRDATRGLLYLHTPTAAKGIILHRDVKPANILLDLQASRRKASPFTRALIASRRRCGAPTLPSPPNFQGNAKLADVGLAREAPELQGGRTHLTTRSLIGTPGFIDPLYAEVTQLASHN